MLEDIDIFSIFKERIRVSVGDIFYLFSQVIDYLVPRVHSHHISVARISFEIASQMGLEEEQIGDIVCAALVHDVGLGIMGKNIPSNPLELENDYGHAKAGYRLLGRVSWTKPLADIILHHHDSWRGPNEMGVEGEEIPVSSRIIHLADSVDIRAKLGECRYSCEYNVVDSLNRMCKPPSVKEDILRYVKGNAGVLFDPEVVASFEKIAKKDAFWFGIDESVAGSFAGEMLPSKRAFLSAEELVNVYSLLAEIVDAKSPFTKNHSVNVAKIATYLAKRMGFSEFDLDIQMLGGLLHDIGKIAVPSALLNKQGRLTKQEFDIMKTHPYITHLILKRLPALQSIDMVASLHHEKMNGTGYPFGFDRKHLSLGSRAMAIADIFSALYERRPYRASLSFREIVDLMTGMVDRNEIDSDIFGIIVDSEGELLDLITPGVYED